MQQSKSSNFWVAIAISALLPALAFAQVEPSTRPEMRVTMSLAAISAKLHAPPETAQGAQLIESGVGMLRGSQVLPLGDELAFAIDVINFCSAVPDHDDELKTVIDLLKARHAGDPNALARILRVEAIGAINIYHNPKLEGALLDEAIENVNKSIADTAILQLDLINRRAESCLGQNLGADVTKGRAMALEFYRKVIEFPLFDEPYFSRIEEFRELYTQAALRVVELAPIAQLRSTSFQPFVLDEIQRTFPRRAAAISTVPMEIKKFNDSMSTWLRLKLRDEPADSPLRPHLQALLDYISNPAK